MNIQVVCVGPAYGEIVYTTKSLEVNMLPDRLRTFVANQARVSASDAQIGCGGGGYIAAATLAKLGVSTAFVGKLGQDSFGCEVVRKLKECKVEISQAQQTTHLATAVQTTIRSPKDDSFEVSTTAFAPSFERKNVPLPSAEWLYLSGPFKDLADLKVLLTEAQRLGMRTCIRLERTDLSNARKLIKILQKADVCCFEQDDAELLTHQPDPRLILESLRSSGLKTLLLQDGAAAGYALHDGYFYRTKAKSKLKYINKLGVSEVFAPAFLASNLNCASVESSLDFALLAARSVAHFVGSEAGLLQNIPHRPGKVAKDFI